MVPLREREKISDPGGVWTHDPQEQITVSLPTELQVQMGAGHGKLRWWFAANEHVSEGVTSKVWPLSTQWFLKNMVSWSALMNIPDNTFWAIALERKWAHFLSMAIAQQRLFGRFIIALQLSYYILEPLYMCHNLLIHRPHIGNLRWTQRNSFSQCCKLGEFPNVRRVT